ncbi:MAG: LD-carboxypeptidase, partial [Planctomycetes bacterium]|nr:LD-carboxypeptidase [Planctomycetota bacterium]
MRWQLPKALTAGDEVAVVLPSSAIRDGDAFARGLDRLRSWGLRPSVMATGSVETGTDWPEGCAVAASDGERLAGLQRALAEPRFRAVFCGRGGYGAGRLLTEIDWSVLAADPKPLVGYSDITALLCAAAAATGTVSFHGPMVATAAAMDPEDDGWRLQRELLFVTDRAPQLPATDEPRTLRTGAAEGYLVGGNLAVLQATIGTPWQPETDGALLFLEDIGEAPYRVDRMLTQLLQTGMLRRCAGVLLGDFHVAGTALASVHPPMQRVLEERLAGL